MATIKRSDELFPEWKELIEFMGYDRTTIWKVIGYGSQNTYDAALTRMKKKGELDGKLKLAIMVYKKMKKEMGK